MSDFFQWDAAWLGLDVREMDQEHQTLIALMNKLHALHAGSAAKPALSKALSDLAQYTAKHFADEEAYMERTGFPQLRVHKSVHEELLQKLGKFAADFATQGTLPDELFQFLKYWLKAHIHGMDRKYAAHAHGA